MKGICPHCEKETELEFARVKENYEYMSKMYEVDAEYNICTECGGDFEDPKSEHDVAKEVYAMAQKGLHNA